MAYRFHVSLCYLNHGKCASKRLEKTCGCCRAASSHDFCAPYNHPAGQQQCEFTISCFFVYGKTEETRIKKELNPTDGQSSLLYG